MKKTNFLATIMSIAFLSFTSLVLTSDANAQGRYSSQYSKTNVGAIISKLEQSSNTFKRDFDRALDNSNLNGTREEDRINEQNKRYDDAVKNLRREFNRENNWWSTRDEVQRVVESAGPINSMMSSISFRGQLQNQWADMRNDINVIADTYDLPGLGSGGWQGGNWGGGGDGWLGGAAVTPPSWARGTFYGRAPNGTQIVLTIQQNGRVSANIGGNMSYGSFTRGNGLYIDGNVSRVQNTNNGFRTISRQNGETIEYSTRNTGGPGWGGPGWGGNNPTASSPPSWARGTFYGQSPRGDRITLVITANGIVSATVNGQPSSGVWTKGNNLFINGNTSRVSRVNNGIRTVSNSDRETITYSKNNNGGPGWGGGNGNAPSWAVGTYTGRAPNGTNITMTIARDGRVTVNIGGNMSYGTLNNSTLTINGATSTVSSIRNGIRTTSNSDGARIDYRRN